jgi:branched-subunit amino acid ABC-type transport system permease component
VRNPLYLGNFMTALGFAIAFCGGLGPRRGGFLTAFGLGTMAAVYGSIVPLEEEYLRETFGPEYDDYVARVPRLVPRATPAEPQSGTFESRKLLAAETNTLLWFGAMLAALAVKAR